MYIAVPVLFVLFSVTTAQNTWEYTVRGIATDGQPCLTNCKNNRCITSWGGFTKDCLTNNRPAPKLYTTQLLDKNSQYCLTNCGYFGFPYQWCVTVQEGWKWDYCNAESRAVSIYKKPCTSECHKGSSDYYWCHVENGNDWQYCAPPREEDFDFDIDTRNQDSDELANSVAV